MYRSTFSLGAFAFISTIINNVLPVLAIPKISAVGNKFFTEEGDQFYIKGRWWLNLSNAPLLNCFLGISYQLIPLDPLIDEAQCKRDAKLMKDLNANAIRVYHVDPTADHNGCMKAFADVGIYLFVDLDTFDTQLEQVSHHSQSVRSFSQDHLLTSFLWQENPEWSKSSFTAFKAVLDEFQQYDNTAGVFVGNEVLTFGELSHHSTESRLILREANRSDTAPYVKASIRDIKAYRDSKKYRKIPVGYSAGTFLRHWLHVAKDVIISCSRSLVLFPSFHSRLSAWVLQLYYFDFGAKIARWNSPPYVR